MKRGGGGGRLPPHPHDSREAGRRVGGPPNPSDGAALPRRLPWHDPARGCARGRSGVMLGVVRAMTRLGPGTILCKLLSPAAAPYPRNRPLRWQLWQVVHLRGGGGVAGKARAVVGRVRQPDAAAPPSGPPASQRVADDREGRSSPTRWPLQADHHLARVAPGEQPEERGRGGVYAVHHRLLPLDPAVGDPAAHVGHELVA
jgi:hypothetical protein